jgi:hypothetical protein
VMIRILLSGLAVVMLAELVNAQGSVTPLDSSPPVLGGAGVRAPTPSPVIGSQNADILRHRDPIGNPCLNVSGFARAHTINPNLYDHLIAAKNRCAQRLTIQVCYYRTQQCIAMEIPGFASKETILGTLPSITDFRYEFRERF